MHTTPKGWDLESFQISEQAEIRGEWHLERAWQLHPFPRSPALYISSIWLFLN